MRGTDGCVATRAAQEGRRLEQKRNRFSERTCIATRTQELLENKACLQGLYFEVLRYWKIRFKIRRLRHYHCMNNFEPVPAVSWRHRLLADAADLPEPVPPQVLDLSNLHFFGVLRRSLYRRIRERPELWPEGVGQKSHRILGTSRCFGGHMGLLPRLWRNPWEKCIYLLGLMVM